MGRHTAWRTLDLVFPPLRGPFFGNGQPRAEEDQGSVVTLACELPASGVQRFRATGGAGQSRLLLGGPPSSKAVTTGRAAGPGESATGRLVLLGD